MNPLVVVIASAGTSAVRVRRPRSLVSSALGVALLTLLLAGCGSSDNGVAAKPAHQILAAARTAAQSASSVHVIANSKVMNGRPFKLDTSLSTQQGQARSSFFGFEFEVIRDGGTLYIKGNRAFDRRLESTQGVKVPLGVWLKGPTASVGQIGEVTDISKELPVILSGSGKVTKGAQVKLDGQPAITLKLTRKLYTGTLYVATTGQPYPLKLVKNGQETGQTTFTNWNDPVTVTPPANAIEIAKLQHLKGH
jgi:hypothetical protein